MNEYISNQNLNYKLKLSILNKQIEYINNLKMLVGYDENHKCEVFNYCCKKNMELLSYCYNFEHVNKCKEETSYCCETNNEIAWAYASNKILNDKLLRMNKNMNINMNINNEIIDYEQNYNIYHTT